MNKRSKYVIGLLCALCTTLCLVGCTEVEQVSYNVSQDADNFRVCRRITVFNTRTDTVLYEFEGFASINVDSSDNQLEITSNTGDGVYKKDFINLSQDTTYIVQDISGADVDKYHYQWSILPEWGIDPTVAD